MASLPDNPHKPSAGSQLVSVTAADPQYADKIARVANQVATVAA